MSDPQKYRSKEEVAEREEQHDPISRLEARLLLTGVTTKEQVEQIDEECKRIAIEAVKFAEGSPDVGVDELYTDVYAQPYGPPYKVGELPIMLTEQGTGNREQKTE
jgi:pyruvate dehydrogenase E1 component alpha subunit